MIILMLGDKGPELTRVRGAKVLAVYTESGEPVALANDLGPALWLETASDPVRRVELMKAMANLGLPDRAPQGSQGP